MPLSYTPGRKGPGAGRPRGSTNKLTIETVLISIENQCGRPFSDLLAEGYYRAITSDNDRLRFEYERMFMAKVVADKIDIDIADTTDVIAAKQAAFAEAIAHLTQLARPPAPRGNLVIDAD